MMIGLRAKSEGFILQKIDLLGLKDWGRLCLTSTALCKLIRVIMIIDI